MQSDPDLAALVAGAQKLGEAYSPTDPLVKQMIDTSVSMAEIYLEGKAGDQSDDPHLLILRSLQID